MKGTVANALPVSLRADNIVVALNREWLPVLKSLRDGLNASAVRRVTLQSAGGAVYETLWTETMPAQGVWLVEARVVAAQRGAGSGFGGSWIVKRAFVAQNGAVTALGSVVQEVWSNFVPAVLVDFAVSGGDVLLRINDAGFELSVVAVVDIIEAVNA